MWQARLQAQTEAEDCRSVQSGKAQRHANNNEEQPRNASGDAVSLLVIDIEGEDTSGGEGCFPAGDVASRIHPAVTTAPARLRPKVAL